MSYSHAPNALLALGLFLLAGMNGQAQSAPLRQVPYSQGSNVVEKLTRGYTQSQLNSQLLAGLGGAVSFSYRDPDTQSKVDVIVALDSGTNRIVYSTSYQGETRISDFGGYGNALNQFNAPTDIAKGHVNLFVADAGNRRVSVLTWLADNGTPGAERTFATLFAIPGGNDFRYPEQLLWDDNGSPGNPGDDVIWVLDRVWATIVGYHITYTGVGPNFWTYSRYVTLNLNELFPAPNPRYPTSFTSITAKGRMAGERLRDEFSMPDHRWVRLRVLMAELEANLSRGRRAFPSAEAYQVFLEGLRDGAPYGGDPAWRGAACEYLKALAAMTEVWGHIGEGWLQGAENPGFFSKGAPKPPAALRVTPRV